jgi:hypothetical protein
MVTTHVRPLMKVAGFTASAPTWRLTAPSGSIGVVNLQKSRWGDGDDLSFYVNLAIVPVTHAAVHSDTDVLPFLVR